MTVIPEFLRDKKIILFNQFGLYDGLRKMGAVPVMDNKATQRGYVNIMTELSGDAGIVHIDHPSQAEGLYGLAKIVVLQRVIGGVGQLQPIYTKLRESGIQLVDNRPIGGNGVDFWTNLIGALAVAISVPLR